MILFFKLGATNAWRNLARSVLAILSMALAAGFLTNAISLSRGYPAMIRSSYRAILGGEIIVYGLPFSGEIPEGESSWTYEKSLGNPFTDLGLFFPELMQKGYLASEDQARKIDDDLIHSLEAFEGISSVYPRYQIPGYTLAEGISRETPLRGRDLIKDNSLIVSPDELLVEGRWFAEEDAGKRVAVISSRQNKPIDMKLPRPGDYITVGVPRISQNGNGLVLDYSNPLHIELEVIGTLEVATREVSTSVPNASGEEVRIQQQMFWLLDEVQIPLETWQNIWNEAADFTYQPYELSLQTSEMAYVEDLVALLRRNYNGVSIYHVPEIATKAENQLLIENYNVLPNAAIENLRSMYVEPGQAAMPLDMRMPLSLMIFLNAALVVASNLLIMINERKTEIGILKAVGALRSEIVSMALAEAIIVACVGAIGGFIFMRVPASLNQLTTRASLGSILSSLSLDLLLVIGASLTASLIFGLLPALRMAGLSVNEVLKSE